MAVMGNDSEFVVNNRTRCQFRRVDSHVNHRPDKCPDRVQDGSIYCRAHKAEAMARVRLVAKS